LCALGFVRAGRREPKMGRESIFELMNAVDANIPQPEPPDRQAVPDADRRRVLDLGPRHGGDGCASSAAS